MYYFVYFANKRDLPQLLPAKNRVSSLAQYFMILPKYLCAKVLTFKYTGISSKDFIGAN